MVVLAGLLNALRVVGKTKDSATIALIGAGAANISVFRLLIAAGFPPQQLIMVDTRGILHQGREDLRTPDQAVKWSICQNSNGDRKTGGIPEALKGVDACIALSRSGPGVIKPEWIATMAKDAIVFACANPVPEVWPWEAKDAGAKSSRPVDPISPIK